MSNCRNSPRRLTALACLRHCTFRTVARPLPRSARSDLLASGAVVLVVVGFLLGWPANGCGRKNPANPLVSASTIGAERDRRFISFVVLLCYRVRATEDRWNPVCPLCEQRRISRRARRSRRFRRGCGNWGKERKGHKKANRQNLPRLWPFSYLGRTACRFSSVAEAEDNPPPPHASPPACGPVRRDACLSLGRPALSRRRVVRAKRTRSAHLHRPYPTPEGFRRGSAVSSTRKVGGGDSSDPGVASGRAGILPGRPPRWPAREGTQQ